MSTSTNIYLGPFAEFKIPLFPTKNDNCPKPKNCPNPTNGFCSVCGLDSKKRFYDTFEQPTKVDVYELTNDVLFNIYCNHRLESIEDGNKFTYYRFIPNIKFGKREMSFGKYGRSVCQEISTELSCEEIAEFFITFKKELEELSKAFGVEAKLKWGLLTYYM